MNQHDCNHDEAAIRTLIGSHFESLKWSPGTQTDWCTFATDFLPSATLYPAARPVEPKSLEQFIERMNGVTEYVLLKRRMC